MNNQLGEIFVELDNKGELNKNPSILILDLPREADLKWGNLPKSNNLNQIFVFATTLVANGYLEIKVGTQFDIIFPAKEINNLINCNVSLKYVNVNPRYEIDYLPGGYTGICLLEFENGIPKNMIDKLAIYETPKDSLKNDVLILTQKSLLEEIMQIKNKSI